MNSESVGMIFISSCLVNNFVLAYFLGICPFLGVSGKFQTALRMGLAVIFVMIVASVSAYFINVLLIIFNVEYLRLICYIAVIASTVQLVEMFIRKYSPALFRALGIYLPLITTNCAILGVALFQTNRQYNFIQSLFFALGAGVGFTLALVIIAGLREELRLSEVPNIVKGAALTLFLAGIMSLSFMGFAGLGG